MDGTNRARFCMRHRSDAMNLLNYSITDGENILCALEQDQIDQRADQDAINAIHAMSAVLPGDLEEAGDLPW